MCGLSSLSPVRWCSLDMLVREYDEWVRLKLTQMGTLVDHEASLVSRELAFVQALPLASLLSVDAAPLLKEAQMLVTSRVSCSVPT